MTSAESGPLTGLSDPDAQSFYVVEGLSPEQTVGVLTGVPMILNTSDAEDDALTAASEESKYDGAMIALIPAEVDIDRLSLEGYEEPEELHLTLFFLGDVAQISQERQLDIIHDLLHAVDGVTPLEVNAFGVAHWNAQSDMPSWVLNVGNGELSDGTWGLTQVRDLVMMYLGNIEMPPQYTPWSPHICLAYTKNSVFEQMIERLGPITLDRLRISFGHDIVDIKLGDDALTAAAGEKSNNIKEYWTKDPRGLAKWVDHPHPWTALYGHLKKHMPDEMAKRVASKWYHEVKGHWPNEGKGKK